jgi:hypothetical protein
MIAPLTANRATRSGKGRILEGIISAMEWLGAGRKPAWGEQNAFAPKWARPTRYDGEKLRQLRKARGVGRPPAVNLARMTISQKVNVNQAWFAWGERKDERLIDQAWRDYHAAAAATPARSDHA